MIVHPPRRRAMTVVELLFTYVVVGLVLALAAGISNYVQIQAKRQLAEDMVLTLREALLAYHVSTEQYPPGEFGGQPARPLEALLSQKTSAGILETWPAATSGETRDPRSWVDPWGLPFRYFTVQSNDPGQQDRVLSDGGVPVFESAGPDGEFGGEDSAAGEDDIASDTAMMIE